MLGDEEPNIVWLCPNPECPPGQTKEDAVADVEETICPWDPFGFTWSGESGDTGVWML